MRAGEPTPTSLYTVPQIALHGFVLRARHGGTYPLDPLLRIRNRNVQVGGVPSIKYTN